MSRNSKNAKNHARADQFSVARKGGTKTGRTASKHGKKAAWWQRFASYAAYDAFLKGENKRKGGMFAAAAE